MKYIFTIILILSSLSAKRPQNIGLKLQKVEIEDTCYNYSISLIKKYEKLRLKQYGLFGHKYTGYGHLIQKKCNPITEPQADSLLKKDFDTQIKYVNSLGLKLSKNKRYTLALLSYNIGIGRLKSSNLIKIIEAKNDNLIEKCFLLIINIIKALKKGERRNLNYGKRSKRNQRS